MKATKLGDAVFLILAFSNLVNAKVRVCQTFTAYFDLTDRQCYYSIQDELNTTQIVEGWGFNTTTYILQTPDGYLLNLFRAHPSNQTQKTPIVLGHGILSNSMTFVYRNNQSLAYRFLELGFDVWLVNWRGTKYSKGHISLSSDDKAYWNYTIDQVGVYDMRAIQEHIYKTTGEQSIFIGYSFGTTVSYVFASSLPEVANTTLKSVINMAPVIYTDLVDLDVLRPLIPLIQIILRVLFPGEFLKQTTLVKDILRFFSLTTPNMYILQTLISLAAGFDYSQMDAISYPIFLNAFFDSIGSKILQMYLQLQWTREFRHYDYGSKQNLKIYNQTTPPNYPIGDIIVPVTMLVSPNDWVGTVKAARKAYDELPEGSQNGFIQTENAKYTHLDFALGKNVSEIVNTPIVQTVYDTISDS